LIKDPIRAYRLVRFTDILELAAEFFSGGFPWKKGAACFVFASPDVLSLPAKVLWKVADRG